MKFLLAAFLLIAPALFAQEGGDAGFNASAMLDNVLSGKGAGTGSGTAVADEETPAGDQGDQSESSESGEPVGEDVGEAEGETEESTEGEGEGEAEALEFDDEIGQPTVVKGPNGENLYQWPEKAARALQSQVKFASELQTAIPDLTVDDAIAHNEAYTDLYRLGHDLKSGTPDSLKRVGQMILNETGNGPAFAGLTEMLVGHVKATNPDAYSRISTAVETDLETELYQAAQEAQSHPDPNVREGYRVLAEMFAFHRNGGNFKPVAEYAKKIDPLDARLQKAEALERQHAERQQQQSAEQVKVWTNAVRSESGTGLKKAVEEAIEPYAKRYEKDPNLKPMILNHVIGQVREKLKADKEWAARFELQYDSARKERSQQSVRRVADLYLARAKGVLKRELPKMLSSASTTVIEQSKQRHDSLRKATDSSHRVPGGSGTPVKRSIAQKPGSFQTPEQYKDHIASLLG